MSISKWPPRRGLAGDKKIRPGRAHNDHAPDAVGREYRGERRGRKEFFTRRLGAKSDRAERRHWKCCLYDFGNALPSLRAELTAVYLISFTDGRRFRIRRNRLPLRRVAHASIEHRIA